MPSGFLRPMGNGAMALVRGILGSLLTICLATTCLATVAIAAAPKMPEMRLSKAQSDFFEQKIRPVLVHQCYQCHSGDPATAKGHLVLDTREGTRKGGDSGPAVVPMRARDSLLIEAIRYEEREMPPKQKLADDVIDDFVRWVEMGAPDPRVGKGANPQNKIDIAEAKKRFWAFQPPKAATAPPVKNSAWPQTAIDRFVLAKLEKEHLKPVADADRMTLLRRVTFDLTGLPPTPEEMDAFISDKSPTAFATVVNRLLASPRFGERWGRHWLDVARYAESTGKERNLPYRYAWRYRDYVIDAFNNGKPYDRFIVEQLAGDLVQPKDDKSAAERDKLLIATGFLAIGPKGVDVGRPEQFLMDQVDDQIDVTTRAFLGMTVACARCHDHKFDPIPTTDYYSLAGIFRSTLTYSGVTNGRNYAADLRLLALTDTAKQVAVTAEQAKAEQARKREIEKVEGQLADLRKVQRQGPPKPFSPKQGKGGANQKQGKGKQQARSTAAPIIAMPKMDPKDLRKEIKELETHLAELETTPSVYGNMVMGVRDAESPTDCNVLERGELQNKGKEVPRGVLTVLKTAQTPAIAPRHSGRLQMAHWIASEENPLTARVMVNRVWEHLFGQGLVDTVDNFGALGNEPSHPELLDALAVQFMADKWSVKRLIRSIVLSRVYQLSSEHNADNFEKDPANKYLWRMERRRLDAEEIRDAILMASGELQLARPEGSAVMELTNKQMFGPRNLKQESNVRSVYLPILRGIVPESLQVFDMADPSLIVGKRDVTTVPTQALYLMNNPFILKQAEHMARRVLDREGLDQAGRINLAYLLALGRMPSEGERGKIGSFLADYRKSLETAGHKGNANLAAWTSVCQTLFATGQFRYLY
jgi:hypothetical protein